MTTTARERVVLDRLKESYEASGYQFFVEPASHLLPSAVANMRPDAIALRGDEKLIIELKNPNDGRFAQKIGGISKILEGGASGWSLVVFPLEEAGSLGQDAAGASHGDIERIIDEAATLNERGHQAAALLLGWGGLEAIARSLAAERGDLPKVALGPGRSVDYLEQMGEITGPEARELRRLIPIRNALSHGLYAEISVPSDKAVEALLKVLSSLTER